MNRIHASAPVDIAGLVPPLLGFQPHNSLVLVPFYGGRSKGAIRADLPASPGRETAVELAHHVVGMTLKAGADAVAVLAYSDEDQDTLLDAVEQVATSAGQEVLALGRVSGQMLREHRKTVWLPVTIDETAGPFEPSIAHTMGLPAADPDLVNRMTVNAIANVTVPEDVTDLFEDVACGREFDEVLLAAALRYIIGRNISIVQFAKGQDAARRLLRQEMEQPTGGGDFGEFTDVIFGAGPQPDANRLRTVLDTLLRVAVAAQHGAGPEQASPVFAAASWVAWALGKATFASVLAENAGDETIARIVRELTANGRLPEWAFAPA